MRRAEIEIVVSLTVAAAFVSLVLARMQFERELEEARAGAVVEHRPGHRSYMCANGPCAPAEAMRDVNAMEADMATAPVFTFKSGTATVGFWKGSDGWRWHDDSGACSIPDDAGDE